MEKNVKSVLVIGLGRVGSLAAILLESNGYQVTGFDTSPDEEYPFKVISGTIKDEPVLEKAISWTTASSVCAVIDLVSQGSLPSQGFLKQEDISLELFLNTPTGQFFK